MPLELLPEYREASVELVRMRGGKELKPGSKANALHFYRVDGRDDLLPSVTTTEKIIDKPGLVGWARNITRDAMREMFMAARPPGFDGSTDEYEVWVERTVNDGWDRMWEKSREGSEKGKSAHEILDELLKTALSRGIPLSTYRDEYWRRQLREMQPLAANAVLAGLDLLIEKEIDLVEVEFAFWHEQLAYGGTIDVIGVDNVGLLVLDWKRSKTLYIENDFQAATYAEMVSFGTGKPCRAMVVRLPQEAEPPDAPAEYRWVDEQALAVRAHVSAQALWENVREYKERTGRK